MGPLLPRIAGAVVMAVALTVAAPARAQNDWQYPDPYFGLFEIEKSRPGGPAPRSNPVRSLPEASRAKSAPGVVRGGWMTGRARRLSAPPAWRARSER